MHECGGEWADSEADGVVSVGAADLTFGLDGRCAAGKAKAWCWWFGAN